MRRLIRRFLRLLFLLAFLAAVAVTWLIHAPARQIPQLPPVDESLALDQGWGLGIAAAARQAYYYTPQSAARCEACATTGS